MSTAMARQGGAMHKRFEEGRPVPMILQSLILHGSLMFVLVEVNPFRTEDGKRVRVAVFDAMGWEGRLW